MVNTGVTVHYFYDPLCGWCFGACPLIEHLAERDDIELILHPGGLFDSRALDKASRQHFLDSDQRIHALSGVIFGDAYQTKMRHADTVVLDSIVPVRAILAAGQCGKSALEMLKRIQLAHYQQGKTVHDEKVLTGLAAEMGIPAEIWRQALITADEGSVIARTANLMRQHQLSGYPSMTVEQDGQLKHIPLQAYFGKPAEWAAYWASLSG
ncbi:DsbA family protein [Photobacterium sp. WH77]|uniref:DsbA family protein n=1 Tax=unclassified Photobacterium TaxID=2628852 RepID=UPI001EDAC04E|nr:MULTISPECIES: DsbA family protein [unclassified Photobacterium]MCG2836459.1 DsbA family protein [Photobacterium sp. WH77]MCG2843914.1 DsbA family protein [Photobacterium sp. WH80]